jgi:hypothetical protein
VLIMPQYDESLSHRMMQAVLEVIREYPEYAPGRRHEDRIHLGLAKDTPAGRPTAIRSGIEIKIQSLPRLGGLHQSYAVHRRRKGYFSDTKLFFCITVKAQLLSGQRSLRASSDDRRISLQSQTEELTPSRKKSF